MTPHPVPVSRRSGCVTALMVVGALLSLGCGVSGIVAFVAARSETGQKIFSALNQGVNLAQKSINAPGVAELRAAGCPEALVMDMKEAMALAEGFIDGGLGDAPRLDYMSVTCISAAGSTVELPTCEALAEVYAKAVRSERSFVVEVKRGGQQAVCSQQYSPDGTFIRETK